MCLLVTVCLIKQAVDTWLLYACERERERGGERERELENFNTKG